MARLEVPYDDDDYRFVQSFQVDDLSSETAQEFLDQFGFIVVRNVLSQAQCDATIDEMFTYLEQTNPGFIRSNPDSWHHWQGRSFGMPSIDPMFTRQILDNRQNPNIHRVFTQLIGTPDLLVNHDRWAIYRPTLIVGDEFRTRENVHLDINPWRFGLDDPSIWRNVDKKLTYATLRDFIAENNQVTQTTRGRQFQAVLNLVDNEVADGGFVIVPGFHRRFAEFANSLRQTDPSCKYAFRDTDPEARNAVRIPVAAGSLIVWDQRCAHGSRGNRSERMRAVQFMKVFSKEGMPTRRRAARRAALKRMIDASGLEVSDTGRIVFDYV